MSSLDDHLGSPVRANVHAKYCLNQKIPKLSMIHRKKQESTFCNTVTRGTFEKQTAVGYNKIDTTN